MKRNVDVIAPIWLTEKLQKRVREIYETKYQRQLSDSEVILIALNHVRFMEHFYQFKWRLNHGK